MPKAAVCQALLADISTLNKLDDAPQEYEFQPVNIPDLLQSIQRDVSMQMEAKHVTFRALVDPEVAVDGNPSLLYSIFRNLTDNSIAYGGEAGYNHRAGLVGKRGFLYL